MKLLIVYGTSEGQTRKIAERMAETARASGHATTVIDSATPEAGQPMTGHDAVVVGASVHQGRHQTSVQEFVAANVPLLAKLPGAFFSVSLSAAVKDEMHQAEARDYLESFLEETRWRPQQTSCIEGAIRQSEYDYFKRLVLELLAGQLGPGVVTAEDREYTDWVAVDRFVEGFLRETLGLRWAENGG